MEDVKQPGVIKYLRLKQITIQYLAPHIVKRWCREFKRCRQSCKYEYPNGVLKSVTTKENVKIACGDS